MSESESDTQEKALRDFGWLVVCRVRQRILARDSVADWPNRMRVKTAEALSEEAATVGVDIEAVWAAFQADIKEGGSGDPGSSVRRIT